MDRPKESLEPSTRLQAEDFRRLGVRPQEWRPTIIRQAAARIARELAQQQLESPSVETGRKLSKVSVSTYRVLDPRLRDDKSHRASIGRILPLALHAASRTRFCDESPDRQVAETLLADFPADLRSDSCDNSFATEEACVVVTADSSTGESSNGDRPFDLDWVPSIAIDSPSAVRRDRIERSSVRRVFGNLRWHLTRPAFITGLIVLMVITTVWVNRSSRDGFANMLADPNKEVDVATSSELWNDPGIDAPEATNGGKWNDRKPPVIAATTDPSVVEAPIPFDPVPIDPVPIDPVPIDPDGGTPQETAAAARAAAARAADQWLAEAGPWAIAVAEAIHDAFRLSESKEESDYLPDPFSTSSEAKSPDSRLAISKGPVPVPSEQEKQDARARLRGKLPELADVVSAKNASGLIVQLLHRQAESSPGSADYWAATVSAAEVGWSVTDPVRVREGLTDLARIHQVPIESLMAETYLNRSVFLETRDSHLSVLTSGFFVAEALMRYQSLHRCQQVISLAERSADFLAHRDAKSQLSDYEDALSQMSRLRLKANDIVRWADAQDVNPGDAGIAGRYHCLFLRDWDGGLRWLAVSKDPRLGPLAKAEWELRKGLSFGSASAVATESRESQTGLNAAELSRLASRWFALASRSDGREAESMRLHALRLDEQAVKSARGTLRLRINREIDEIRGDLSRFTFENPQLFPSASRTL